MFGGAGQGPGARLPAQPPWPLGGWGSRGAGHAPKPVGRGPWRACPGLPRPSGLGPAVPAERGGAQGCPRQPRPLAVRRGPGSVRGTRSPPRGTAQVSAGAAGREWGSAPISPTGKSGGGRHGGGGEGVRTAVGAGVHSREKGRTAGPGTAPSPTPAGERASPTHSAGRAGAPAEPESGCRRSETRRPETRRRRPAAHQPRCAPSPRAAPAPGRLLTGEVGEADVRNLPRFAGRCRCPHPPTSQVGKLSLEGRTPARAPATAGPRMRSGVSGRREGWQLAYFVVDFESVLVRLPRRAWLGCRSSSEGAGLNAGFAA